MKNTKTYLSIINQPTLYTEKEVREYTEATTAQRFLNYLIDNLLMQFVLGWTTLYLLVNVFGQESFDTAYPFIIKKSKLMSGLLIGAINFVLYYTICEKVFKGYTLGKLVTGTRAIREDGDELTLKDALMRSFCRLVPLEAVSILFGYGLWHDVWSKTKVIKA